MNSSASATTTVNYKAPLQDIQFQLEAFNYEAVAALESFESYDLETSLNYRRKVSDLLIETWLPTNQIGDIEGVTYHPEDKFGYNTRSLQRCLYLAYAEWLYVL